MFEEQHGNVGQVNTVLVNATVDVREQTYFSMEQ